MAEQVISYADLSIINNALRSISSDMSGVHSELGDLNNKQDQLEDELEKLADAFATFVEEDRKHKALQLAETRVGNLRQELQIKFGYYSEVRRMATGILQGVDTGVLSDDTLRFTTEEVMIKAPGYWLAPSLVTLASWIRNDKNNADKALNESLKRDDYKTTLFFMLVMRRLSRNDASMKWLERYFMHQNPHNLDREFIVILEAVTTGVFPPASRQLMMSNVKNWLDQLTQGDNFINEQKSQWVKFFEAKGPLPDGKYPLLEKFATNWNALEVSMKESKTHGVLQTHFKSIFAASSDFSKAVKVQLDEILSMLVTNFDDEELPLQQQVRMNQLIIQMEGDKNAAQAMMDAEKHIFDEKVDFLQMLTNAAFNPELSGATKVTQALAVSISQPWIVEAHDTFTANSRNKIPVTVDLDIDGFKSSTKDGSDENEQIQKHDNHWSNILQNELSKLSFPTGMVIIGALICLGGLYGFTINAIVGILGLGIGGVLIWNSINNHNKAKKTIANNIEERKTKSREVLRGCIAETVDYRKESSTEDANAEGLRQLLTSITAEDFSSVSVGSKTKMQTN
jgi:acyl carrier protein phosphodiesterase